MATQDGWSETRWTGDGEQGGWVYRKNRSPALPVGSARYPDVAYLTVSFEPGEAVGMPRAPEVEDLAHFEAQAAEAFATEEVAVFVAVVLKVGMRDLIYYTRAPEAFRAIAREIEAQCPQYRLAYEVFHDPTWQQYGEMP